ncbi:MAG: cadherin-like domain-containing protein [Pirellulales bacterium]
MRLQSAWSMFFGYLGYLRRNRRQRKAAIAKRRNLRRRHRMEALEQRVVLNADAVDDTLDTGYESPIVISAGQLTANDNYNGTPTVTPNFGTTAQGGTLSDNGDGTYTYTPPSGFDGTDTFDYTLDDEDPSSDTATVSINVAGPDPSPYVTTNAGLSLVSGESATIDNSVLQTTDLDTAPENITYSLDSAPGNGTLYLNYSALTSGSTFTQADINSGALTYQHVGGGSNADDSFAFTVSDSDGHTTSSYTFTIAVSAEDPNPHLVNNSGLSISYGDMAEISDDLLLVEDDDSSRGQLTYVIATLPTSGTLYLNGSVLYAGSAFTQANISNGQISYSHWGSSGSDSFTFTVSDELGHSIEETTFWISIADPPANTPPSINVLSALSVVQGSYAVLAAANITAEDDNDGPAWLTYTLASLPVYGELLLEGSPLSVGSTFTQETLNNGYVRYQHDGGGSTGDSFSLFVSDSEGASSGEQTLEIDVEPLIPVVTTNSGLTFTSSDPASIDDSILEAEDADSAPEDLLFTIVSAPTAGTLYLNGVPLSADSTFTQADVNSGLLTYQYDSVSTDDSFLFTVTDAHGNSTDSQTFSISYVDPHPYLTTNEELAYWGEEEFLDGTVLEVVDANTSAENLIYSIVTWPTNGSILKDGVPLPTGGTFTQQDVYDGRVSYSTGGFSSDSFTFIVTDDEGHSTEEATFSIHFYEIDPPSLTTNDRLEVEQDVEGMIGADLLSVSDADSAAEELTFTIVDAPMNGELRLNGVLLEAGSQFLQSDVNVGALSYQPAFEYVGDDSFTFFVTDQTGNTTEQYSFSIRVGNPETPLEVQLNSGLMLSEGDTAEIMRSALLVSGHDSVAEYIVFTLVTAPENGVLLRDGVALAVDSTFTQADIDNGLLAYAHDGGETTSDSFTFTVVDEWANTIDATTFSISITSVNDTPNVVISTILNVVQGQELAIPYDVLQATDEEDDSQSLEFTVTAVPTLGWLTWQSTPLSVGSTFTQADLEAGYVAYQHDSGANIGEDSFKFVVTDSEVPCRRK